MNKNEAIWPSCGKTFIKTGTTKYCPDADCYKKEKRLRQNFVDSLTSQIKKGLYANIKIFREKLPNTGQVKMEYDDALKMGFDENAFYGSFRTKEGALWYKVNDYLFLIEIKNNSRFLHIYK